MMHIDERIPAEILAQFATQEGVIPPHVVHGLSEQFTFEQSRTFYEGLAAGLRYAYQMADRSEKKTILGAMLALTAGHITRLPEVVAENEQRTANFQAQQEKAFEKHDEQMALARRLGMGVSVADCRKAGLDVSHGVVPDTYVLKGIVVDGLMFGPP